MYLSAETSIDGTVLISLMGDGKLPAPIKVSSSVEYTCTLYRRAVTATDVHLVHDGAQRPLTVRSANTKRYLAILDTDPPLRVQCEYTLVISAGASVGSTSLSVIAPVPAMTGAVNLDVSNCFPVLLSNPSRANETLWVGLLSIDSLSYPARRELFNPIASPYPIAVSDVRGAASTSLRIITKTLAQRSTLLKMLGYGTVLCFRIPDSAYPERYLHISIADVSESRIYQDHANPTRVWSFEVNVVRRYQMPVLSVSSVTFSTVSAVTWARLRDLTWDNMLYGTEQAITGQSPVELTWSRIDDYPYTTVASTSGSWGTRPSEIPS